jgi:hypothetical protein
MKKIFIPPNIQDLTEYNTKALQQGASKNQLEFIASEMRRMAALNTLLGNILLKERIKESWIKDLEEILLKKNYSAKELKAKTPKEKKSMLVSLLYPSDT